MATQRAYRPQREPPSPPSYFNRFFGQPPRTIIDKKSLPTREVILEFLHLVTLFQANDGVVPEGKITWPPLIPDKVMKIAVLNDPNLVNLRVEDITSIGGARDIACAKLCNLLTLDCISPVNSTCGLYFRKKAMMTRIDENDPSLATTMTGNHMIIGSITDTFNLIRNCIPNKLLHKGTKHFYAAVPAQHYTTDCTCHHTSSTNNYSHLQFGLICKHTSLFKQYTESDDIPPAALITDRAPKKHHNSSTIFAAQISSYGTVHPIIIRRSSTACITRQKPVKYEPMFAGIDILSNSPMARLIATHISRCEFAAYTKNFAATSGIAVAADELYRFRPAAQLTSQDVKANPTAESTEDILINSTLCEPYAGKILCPFCADYIPVVDISCIMSHLHNVHLDALSANFSCPSCISVRIYSANKFNAHWIDTHAPTLALLPVLNEVATGHRLQFGLAVHTLLAAAALFKIQLPPNTSPAPVATRYGGHGPQPASEIAAKIRSIQQECMPIHYVAANADFMEEKQKAAAAAKAKQTGPRFRRSSYERESEFMNRGSTNSSRQASPSPTRYRRSSPTYATAAASHSTQKKRFCYDSQPQEMEIDGTGPWRNNYERSPSPEYQTVNRRRNSRASQLSTFSTTTSKFDMPTPSASILDEDDEVEQTSQLNPDNEDEF